MEDNNHHIETIDVSELVHDDKNFNKGTEKGAKNLRKSLKRFSAGRVQSYWI